MEENRRKLTLIQSDEGADVVRASLEGQNVVEVDLFVRGPDKESGDDIVVAARLCSCRRVCIAIVEPDGV